MRIELLYVADCPHWRQLDTRLRAALSAVGRAEPIEHVLVTTTDEARARGFHGSPALHVDGRDLFAAPGAPVGLACRLYRAPDGLTGSPTVEQLIEVMSGSGSPDLP